MAKTAFFRFYGQLNDFLKKAKKAGVPYSFSGTPAVKDAIEAIGVPHVEAQAILINNQPVHFYYPLKDKDFVEVYPAPVHILLPDDYALRKEYPVPQRFVLDVHLGSLAKALRLLGFDTIYKNNFSDKTIADIAERDQRIVLTRDIGLLKHRSITWGRWLRSQHVKEQIIEVIHYFNLSQNIRIFTRCLACNGIIKEVVKETVAQKLPPKANVYFDQFFQCMECKRVYWQGSHYNRMLETIAEMKLSLNQIENNVQHGSH